MGGKALPNFPGGKLRLLGSPGKGPGADPMSPATICPPKCSDSVPLTPKWATAASESVPSSNSESRPPHPGFLPSLHLVATLGVGSGGGSPHVRAFPLHLPLPRPWGLVLKDSLPLPLPNLGQGQGGQEPPRLEGKGLLCSWPSLKGRVSS